MSSVPLSDLDVGAFGRWALGVFFSHARHALPTDSRHRSAELPPVDFFDVAAIANPFRAQRRKSLCHIAVKIRITPWAARVVNPHRLVDLDFTVHRLSRRERDLAERNTDVGMQSCLSRKPSSNSESCSRDRLIALSGGINPIAGVDESTGYSFVFAFSVSLVHWLQTKAMRGKSHG